MGKLHQKTETKKLKNFPAGYVGNCMGICQTMLTAQPFLQQNCERCQCNFERYPKIFARYQRFFQGNAKRHKPLHYER